MDSRLRGNDVFGWFLTILLVWICVVPASAQTFPTLTGRVVDAANIIPDADEAALDAKLKALEDTTDRQLVVATIPSLEGYPIDDYGYRLGRAWGIGQKEGDNGAILILAPNETPGSRGPRVEVGYGLEPILTDAWSSVMINSIMMPLLRGNEVPAAINAGTDALIAQLQLPPEEAAKRAAQAAKKSSSRKSSGVSLGDVIVWLVIFFFFILPMLRSIFGGKRGRRHGSGPIIIWGGGNDDDWGGGGGWGGGFGGGGGFSGGGGSFGGGGASGGW
ncbi:MAG: TPM domain-containing protein [Pseudomonadota bacterium]